MSRKVGFGDWLLLTGLIVLWGSSFAMTKIAVASMGPAWVMALRLVVAAIVLLPIAIVSGRSFALSNKVWGKFAWLAVVGHALPFFLISWGTQFISSGVSGILMGAIPLFVVVLAHLYLADEKLTAMKALGFVIGFCGLLYLIGPSELLAITSAGDELVGELAVIGGCVSYSIHAVSAKRLGMEDPILQTTAVCALGAVMGLAAAMLAEPAGLTNATSAAVWSVIGLGLLPTAAASLLMYAMMARTGPSFISYSNYLVPVYALFFGAAALGEELNARVFVALGLILIGIAVSRISRRA
ncbi:MAG: DMT family transporter [Aestuariivirga sp.]